jgi:hypothetical protein
MKIQAGTRKGIAGSPLLWLLVAILMREFATSTIGVTRKQLETRYLLLPAVCEFGPRCFRKRNSPKTFINHMRHLSRKVPF